MYQIFVGSVDAFGKRYEKTNFHFRLSTDQSCNLIEGQTYPLTVTGGDSYGGGSWNMFTFAYIDWNMDGAFDPVSEMYELGLCNSAGGTVSIDVTPPAGSAASCFMRIVQGWDGEYPPVLGVYNDNLGAINGNGYGTTVSHGTISDFFVTVTNKFKCVFADGQLWQWTALPGLQTTAVTSTWRSRRMMTSTLRNRTEQKKDHQSTQCICLSADVFDGRPN